MTHRISSLACFCATPGEGTSTKFAHVLGLGLRLLVPSETFALTRPIEKICGQRRSQYILYKSVPLLKATPPRTFDAQDALVSVLQQDVATLADRSFLPSFLNTHYK